MNKVLYFKTSDNEYVKKENGEWKEIFEGFVLFNPIYKWIDEGKIQAVEISEEEFNDALERSIAQEAIEAKKPKKPRIKYYKAYDGSYFKHENALFYVIIDGELVKDDYYSQILIGELYADEISEEEFNNALQKSKDGIEGYR
ncbi:MAG: hypothetical protein GXY89_06765 [Tissierellia bacterium]|nr:hypothetical protein [Tissierellia bacterium]